jgi:hypothetical protein
VARGLEVLVSLHQEEEQKERGGKSTFYDRRPSLSPIQKQQNGN